MSVYKRQFLDDYFKGKNILLVVDHFMLMFVVLDLCAYYDANRNYPVNIDQVIYYVACIYYNL